MSKPSATDTQETTTSGNSVGRVVRWLAIPVILLAIGVGIAYFADSRGDSKSEKAVASANLITITQAANAADGSRVNFDDLAQIERVLAELDVEGLAVTPHLSLPHSVADSKDEAIHIIGIDSASSGLVGLDEMKDNVAYSLGGSAENVALDVRVITEHTADGVVSDRSEKLHIDREPGLAKKSLESLTGGAPGETWVVTVPTFWKFAETMFDTDQASITESSNTSELAFTGLISEILVSFQDSKDLKTVRAALADAGY